MCHRVESSPRFRIYEMAPPSCKEKKKMEEREVKKEGRPARTMMNVTKFGIEGGKVSPPPLPPFFHSFFHPVITTMNQPLIPITTLPFPPNFHQ